MPALPDPGVWRVCLGCEERGSVGDAAGAETGCEDPVLEGWG